MTYSVAIRTLGKGGEVFRRELEQLHAQTVPPTRILIYLAKGYDKPDFTVGREEYVIVDKGMMTQRILPYNEIEDECILFLDDDVELQPDSVERLLRAMKKYDLDVVGPDSFKNHEMSMSAKTKAALSNWVFPHADKNTAFKIHRWGTFSYINSAPKDCVLSESCSGPASLWKKSVFTSLNLCDELWLEKWGFPYGEDLLTFYKLTVNGFRLGILFDSGIAHMDSRTSSTGYKRDTRRFYIRAIASYLIWHRAILQPRPLKALSKLAFWTKQIATFPFVCAGALAMGSPGGIVQYVKGLADGVRMASSEEFRSIPPYKLSR